MKIDAVKVVRIVGMAATIAGTIAGAWVSKKDADATLKKLVEEQSKSK